MSLYPSPTLYPSPNLLLGYGYQVVVVVMLPMRLDLSAGPATDLELSTVSG